MKRQARSSGRARHEPEAHVETLSPESAAIMADVITAIRATPRRDLRTVFEEVVARRAGVMRVRLRPLDPIAPPQPRHPASPETVTVTWHGAIFVLDAEPHTRDRGYVTGVLRSAASMASAILRAQGVDLDRRSESTFASLIDEHLDRLVGSSRSMQDLRLEIERCAQNNFTVLIEGESGVGKELVARQIHACSSRRRGPFVPVNCAAVVESLFESELFGIEEGVATGVRARKGKFEQANNGTLFLDEITELPLPAQAKLLRAVQDFAIERVGSQSVRRVDVRLIVATNRSLSALVDQGHFRRDLYFRLRSIHIRVPPLRDRREDIVEIADAYLRRCVPNRPPNLSPLAAGILCLHHWPGNVRELERALEAAMTRSLGHREILAEHLAPELGQPYRDVMLPPGESDESLRSLKTRYARFKYDQYRGNKRKTCKALNVSYHTLMALLKRSGNGTKGLNLVKGTKHVINGGNDPADVAANSLSGEPPALPAAGRTESHMDPDAEFEPRSDIESETRDIATAPAGSGGGAEACESHQAPPP
jgi:DNA-binding NtrC family response regulator